MAQIRSGSQEGLVDIFSFVVHMNSVVSGPGFLRSAGQMLCRGAGLGQGMGIRGLTQAGCGSGIWRVPILAVAAEGAKAVDALTMGTQVREHMALVHIWG